MESKHTPGPWKMEIVTVSRKDSNTNIFYQIKGPDNYYVGVVAENNDHPCNIANARLAAAAPEMYELLTEVTNSYDTGDIAAVQIRIQSLLTRIN